MALKHISLQQVEFYSLQTKPTEHWEQGEVQHAGDNGAHNLEMWIKEEIKYA